jgi:hypothetical protein
MSAGIRFLAAFELKPLANTGGQDADFTRLMDVDVRSQPASGSGPRCLEREEDDAMREIEIHS